MDVIDLSYKVIVNNKIKVLLKEVNLHIKSGEMCAVMGPSGAGKR